MAVGSFGAINFEEIEPVGIPGLASVTRAQDIPGTLGGIEIRLGFAPVDFYKTVLVQSTAAKESLDLLRQTSGTLVVHEASSTCSLIEVELLHEIKNQHQELRLMFRKMA